MFGIIGHAAFGDPSKVPAAARAVYQNWFAARGLPVPGLTNWRGDVGLAPTATRSSAYADVDRRTLDDPALVDDAARHEARHCLVALYFGATVHALEYRPAHSPRAVATCRFTMPEDATDWSRIVVLAAGDDCDRADVFDHVGVECTDEEWGKAQGIVVWICNRYPVMLQLITDAFREADVNEDDLRAVLGRTYNLRDIIMGIA